MKKFFKFVAISFAILAFAACAEESKETPVSFTRELTFTATREGLSPESKSVRMDDGSTWWNANEEISVFYGSGSAGGSKFTTQNNTLQDVVEFSGSVQMSGSGKDFWAVYPYSEENECDGSSITTVIPAVQIASEGNFSDDVFPAMAKSKTTEFAFWNICGGIKFFVSRSDIKSVTIKGNGGEALAGKVKVAFNADGHPEVTEVIESETEVTLDAPDGGCFKPGKYYYITLLPTTLESGITLAFYTSSEKGVIVSDKAQTVKRSIFGVLKNIDSKVTEWKSTEPEAVDLGLSVKWANFNLGATDAEEYGDYYAWGETAPKSDYSWSTYVFELGTDYNGPFSKYVTSSVYGTVDDKTVLDPEDDAARAEWGDNWRMPTAAEWDELNNKCYKIWTDNYNGTGIAGTIVSADETCDSDKSIFIPAAGRRDGTSLIGAGSGGFYWSSSLDANNPWCANDVNVRSDKISMISRFSTHRDLGRSVRPVYDDRVHPESVSLNKPSLSLIVGDSQQLVANVLPSNATDTTVSWSSDNTDAAAVDASGNVTAIAAGSATITATTNDRGLTASCVVTVILPEAVDLGLSVNWATFNVGATKPEEYGDYYAWGETEWKDYYSWETYKWCNGTSNSLTKYNTNSSLGTVDNKMFLERGENEDETVDDVARAKWGGGWQIPTDEEWRELLDNCTWIWTDNYNGTGLSGRIVISNKPGYTDKSIFLPAAGFRNNNLLDYTGMIGRYWSSLINKYQPYYAFIVYLDSNDEDLGLSRLMRSYGHSVRPVCPKK